MPSTHLRYRPLTVAGILILAALSLCSTAGCGLWQRRYTPRSLPAELEAREVKNAQSLDVARFAGPVVAKDRIERGDVLTVSLAASLDGEAITELSVRVGDDGIGMLPEIGPLRLAGLTPAQAEAQIARACVERHLYRHPLVTVTMEQQRVNRVTVAGAVEEPGVVELPHNSSYLLDAIVAAGGFTEDAGVKVSIRHQAGARRLAGAGGPDAGAVQPASYTEEGSGGAAELVCLDLSDERTRRGRGEYLEDGSVVTVERLQPAPIQVVGLVKKPDQYEFPVDHELRVYGAIAMAGGLSSQLADEVLVLRNNPEGGELATIRISLKATKKDAAENIRLAPGDIVSVEPSPASILVDTIKLIHFGIGTSMPLF